MCNIVSSDKDFDFNFGASKPSGSALNTQYSTMAQYITDMQAIEADKIPATTATNTQVMITKFRKIYYNSTGWNEILVPDTENIAALPLSAAKKAMAKCHETAIPDGNSSDNQPLYLEYDAAHIFAILDASNHNGTLSPLSLLGSASTAKLPDALKDIVPVVHDRLMACGWLGDLSEIIGEFYLQKPATKKARQNIIDQFGAYYKNLANVDGMVMVDTYRTDLSSADGKKLSAIFADYYGADGKSGEREKRKATRYKTFATMIGLKWGDSGFTNTDQWVTDQQLNLRTCAAFYLANKCLKKGNSVKKELAAVLKADMKAALQNTLLSELEKQFARFLNDEIQKSANGLEDDLVTLIICFLMWIGKLDVALSVHDVLTAFADGLATAIKETTAAA